MRRLTVPIALLSTLLYSVPSSANDGEHARAREESRVRVMLAFQTMYGVDGPFIGDANPIRGIPGDEAPWEIARGVIGKLFTDGHLLLHVRGLVFKDSPLVQPPSLIGTNDSPEFRAIVSCLTEDGDTTPVVNTMSPNFPADAKGNSDIDAHLDLPNPCVAPIVFVLPGDEFKWFAVTGFEAEE